MANDLPNDAEIDFSSIVRATKKPKGLIVTCVTTGLSSLLQCILLQRFLESSVQ